MPPLNQQLDRFAGTVTDQWLETTNGRLLSRCWKPAAYKPEPLPIVLIHDSLGCIALWRSFPACLAEKTGRRVIAYDRLGYGQSDPNPVVSGQFARDFIQQEATLLCEMLCPQLGLARFIAFGHSVGGGMALHCAAHYPDMVAALVSESAQALVEEKTLAGLHQAERDFSQPELYARLERYHGDKTSWALQAWLNTWLSPGFRDWSLQPCLPGVLCPTLVIHGSEDEYGSARHPDMISGQVNGPSELELLAGLGHFPHREQEAWVAKRVARFITDHQP